MANRIQLRRDTTLNWQNTDPVLADGEPGYDINTNEVRVGDGSTAWTGLSGNVIGTGGGGGGATTGNITFNDFTIIGTGNIQLQPDDQDSSYLDVFLTGGADVHVATGAGHLILGRDNAANVSVRNTGIVDIQSYGASAKIWSFDTAGKLTTPAATNGVIIDATAARPVSMAQNDTVDFTNFSGEILVNDILDGYMYKLLVGSGKVCMLGTTNPAWNGTNVTPSATYTLAGEFTIEFVGGSALYRFTNLKSVTRTMNFAAIMTRASA